MLPKGRAPVHLNLETIAPFFGTRQQEAAQKLGISTTTLKQVCRKLGVSRWPYMRSSKKNRIKTESKEQIAQIAADKFNTQSFPQVDGSESEFSEDSFAESYSSAVTVELEAKSVRSLPTEDFQSKEPDLESHFDSNKVADCETCENGIEAGSWDLGWLMSGLSDPFLHSGPQDSIWRIHDRQEYAALSAYATRYPHRKEWREIGI